MSLETKGYFGPMIDRFVHRPMGCLLTNPIGLAVVLTIVIMFIVAYTYDGDHKMRTGIRIFVACVVFAFINNHKLMSESRQAESTGMQKRLLSGIEGGGGASPAEVIEPADSDNFQ